MRRHILSGSSLNKKQAHNRTKPLHHHFQNDRCRIICKLCSGHGNMYGMIKEVLRKMGCPDCGSVRAPLAELIESDLPIADECAAMIRDAVAKYC